MRGLSVRCYLLGDTTPASFVVQNAVVGVVKEQTQPLVAQGWVALQVPPQVANPFASLRNCRAETVPAQRTPMTSAVKNIDLIFFMIASSLSMNLTDGLPYFAASAVITWHLLVVNPSCLTHPSQNVGAR